MEDERLLKMPAHPITFGRHKHDFCAEEHRSCQRCSHSGAVFFNVFNSDQPPQVGDLRNYCELGLCFEATHFVKPGTALYIRIVSATTRHSEPAAIPGCRTISLAEVKWCRDISEGENPRFGIGTKFY